MLKILLIGKTGQVGADLAALLPSLGEVVGLDRNELDLRKLDEIRGRILEARPNVIVNAAGYTAVDQAETDEDLAIAINAKAPAVMAEAAKQIGAALVHYSTDYVFDGLKGAPYTEEDAANPINAYGRTKLEGERAIQAAGVPHLIFRCSWVYATRGKNFLLSILRLATEREELRIVRDQKGAPTWSREIAAATARVLRQLFNATDAARSIERATGIYHMTAAGETTWYDFARAILEEAAFIPTTTPWFASATQGRPLIAKRVVPIATSEYPTPARRPPYSVLSNARLSNAFGLQLPEWRAQLREAFRETEDIQKGLS